MLYVWGLLVGLASGLGFLCGVGRRPGLAILSAGVLTGVGALLAILLR